MAGFAAVAVVVAVFVCLLTLLGGFALKKACPSQSSGTYPTLCYTDITALYRARGFDDDVLPYIDFPKDGSYADRGFLEYPVGTGAIMTVTALLASTSSRVLERQRPSARLHRARVCGAPAGFGARASLLWAASPLLALYAFHNWDLLAVGCVVAGCVARARSRPGWAGVWFGLGAAAKLFPVLFLIPLVLERVWARDRAGATRASAGGSAAFLLPNVLVAFLNRDGWWATYAFHSERGADLGSIWGLVLSDGISPRTLNLFTGLLFVLSGVAVLGIGWRRAVREGAFPFLSVAGALVAVFLLWSKVASPQYTLWLLPVLVLLPIGVQWWFAWAAVGVLVYAVSFGVGLDGYEAETAPSAIKAAALARAVGPRRPGLRLLAGTGSRQIAGVMGEAGLVSTLSPSD